MIERRKTPRKEWVIGRDDTGRSVLEWKVDYRATKRQSSDPLEKTYDFLKRLEVPHLELEDDAKSGDGINPYDTGVFRTKRDRR